MRGGNFPDFFFFFVKKDYISDRRDLSAKELYFLAIKVNYPARGTII